MVPTGMIPNKNQISNVISNVINEVYEYNKNPGKLSVRIKPILLLISELISSDDSDNNIISEHAPIIIHNALNKESLEITDNAKNYFKTHLNNQTMIISAFNIALECMHNDDMSITDGIELIEAYILIYNMEIMYFSNDTDMRALISKISINTDDYIRCIQSMSEVLDTDYAYPSEFICEILQYANDSSSNQKNAR